MVITNLQEKQNRKIWVPIRGGNRGGWSLFNWEDVRQMPYKDREMYLGNSVTIGVLDKGGKWRKRDWYTKTDKKYMSKDLTVEQSQAMKRDQQRMNSALGYKDFQEQEKLTQSEMKQLMKKLKMKKEDYQQPSTQNTVGLGFDKSKVQIRAKPSIKTDNPHRLEAIDDEDEQKSKKQKKIKKQKKQKKEKKEKKQKKQKKDKKSHKHQKEQKQLKHQENSRKEKKKRHSSSQSSR